MWPKLGSSPPPPWAAQPTCHYAAATKDESDLLLWHLNNFCIKAPGCPATDGGADTFYMRAVTLPTADPVWGLDSSPARGPAPGSSRASLHVNQY